MIRALAATLALALCPLAADARVPVAGAKPTKIPAAVTTVPNEAAIVRAYWFPGIDGGYVPQGLSTTAESVLVAGYHDDGKRHGTKPGRVWRVRMRDGAVTGYFDLPGDVKHAGGLAYAGNRRLYVADKGLLYEINLDAALAQKKCSKSACRRITMEGGLGGSFAAWDRKANRLWVGNWVDDGASGKPRIHRINPAGRSHLRVAQAERTLSIPRGIQGAAIGDDGRLWVTGSDSKYGRLRVLEPRTGATLKRWEMSPGIEDLSFRDGLLWSVSEAGVLKWRKWKTDFPVIFAVDVRKLK